MLLGFLLHLFSPFCGSFFACSHFCRKRCKNAEKKNYFDWQTESPLRGLAWCLRHLKCIVKKNLLLLEKTILDRSVLYYNVTGQRSQDILDCTFIEWLDLCNLGGWSALWYGKQPEYHAIHYSPNGQDFELFSEMLISTVKIIDANFII